jgi:cytochrome c-type biogenesis protein CcmH/NrfF
VRTEWYGEQVCWTIPNSDFLTELQDVAIIVGRRGMFVLYSQSRILLLLGLFLIVALVASGVLLRWYLRRRKRLECPLNPTSRDRT